MSEAVSQKNGRVAKPASPPAPSRTFQGAVEDVQKVYAQFSHGTFTQADIASVLGVSATSGPFRQRLFSLKSFGLLEAVGASYKVSDLFLTLRSAPADTAEFKGNALEAIRRPQLFRDLLDDFKSKLPARHIVAQRLETQKKFNPDRAKEAARILEDSLRFVGLLDANNNLVSFAARQNAPDSESAQESAGAPGMGGGGTGTVDRTDGAYLTIEIPVRDGMRVTVLYPPDLTSHEATKVGRVLAAIVE
jgi:hypothetical protein